MSPYYDRSGVTLYRGHVIDVLKSLPEESVNCCITSPPYWGLRDYGTAEWDGGNDAACEHKVRNDPKTESSTLGGGEATTGHQREGFGEECPRCGAIRIDQQIGLEPTPGEYVDKMVEVFREVRRVLRNDGTVWLNLGDSYANDAKWGGSTGGKHAGGLHGEPIGRGRRNTGLKAKDLVGIPWRVAFALQADGWWLRSDIIWAKPAPMPESVTDRPTRSHEYIFLLAKSESYYCDMKAIAEPVVRGAAGSQFNTGKTAVHQLGRSSDKDRVESDTRNKRDVWTVNSDPFPEAHFATFPPALILPCVLAGCPVGGVVLDPFSGAGTSAMVAKENGRRAIGCDLNPDYLEMSARRLSQEVLFGVAV
jgi:DNA modification methylase